MYFYRLVKFYSNRFVSLFIFEICCSLLFSTWWAFNIECHVCILGFGNAFKLWGLDLCMSIPRRKSCFVTEWHDRQLDGSPRSFFSLMPQRKNYLVVSAVNFQMPFYSSYSRKDSYPFIFIFGGLREWIPQKQFAMTKILY